ncbi:uncharacterized protein PG986_014675 [Apiospora aurea]|uniref:Uncharacterized protein n=1 Tax=Apiospora aurea TaxID=335848 RepID=A0ABR1PTN6_9PEZI
MEVTTNPTALYDAAQSQACAHSPLTNTSNRAGFKGFFHRQLFESQSCQSVDLKGKTAIVTRSNTGLGLDDTERAKALARLDILVLNADVAKTVYKRVPATGHEETIQLNVLSMVLFSILFLPVLKSKSLAGGSRRWALACVAVIRPVPSPPVLVDIVLVQAAAARAVGLPLGAESVQIDLEVHAMEPFNHVHKHFVIRVRVSLALLGVLTIISVTVGRGDVPAPRVLAAVIDMGPLPLALALGDAAVLQPHAHAVAHVVVAALDDSRQGPSPHGRDAGLAGGRGPGAHVPDLKVLELGYEVAEFLQVVQERLQLRPDELAEAQQRPRAVYSGWRLGRLQEEPVGFG